MRIIESWRVRDDISQCCLATLLPTTGLTGFAVSATWVELATVSNQRDQLTNDNSGHDKPKKSWRVAAGS